MAWVKVPPENHPIFHAALPKDPRVETLNMMREPQKLRR